MPKIKWVNRLRISQDHDGQYSVRSPDNDVLKREPTFDRAYKWAHGCREWADKEPPWASWELEFLNDNYGIMSREDIAKKLNRSPNSQKIIAYRRFRMNQKTNIYTARATAAELGLSCAKIVVAWHDRGYLKGTRAPFFNGPNQVWFFTYEDILQCITDRPWLCRLKRMPEGYFRSIVQTEWEKNPWYTRAEAAEFLGMVTAGPVDRYIKAGWLPAVRRPMGGSKGEWMIRHSVLSEFQLHDPRPAHRKSATLADSMDNAMKKALSKAFAALARKRWALFGYWAGVWSQLNSINRREGSPFQPLVDYAKTRQMINTGISEEIKDEKQNKNLLQSVNE